MSSATRTRDEVCFCRGIGLGHYPCDYYSHNVAVRQKIESNPLCQNAWCHPYWEARWEMAIEKYDSIVYQQTRQSLDVMITNPRYCEIINQILGTNTQLDCNADVLRLRNAYGSWVTVYAPQTSTLASQLYLGLSSSIGNEADYQEAVSISHSTVAIADKIADDWIDKWSYSPHGFDALSQADSKNSSTLQVMLAGIIVILVIVMLSKRRGH